MQYLPSYYENLQDQLRDVFDELSSRLDTNERRWILEWIDVGEYGLAMISLLEHLQRHRENAPESAIRKVSEIATRIGLEEELMRLLPPSST